MHFQRYINRINEIVPVQYQLYKFLFFQCLVFWMCNIHCLFHHFSDNGGFQLFRSRLGTIESSQNFLWAISRNRNIWNNNPNYSFLNVAIFCVLKLCKMSRQFFIFLISSLVHKNRLTDCKKTCGHLNVGSRKEWGLCLWNNKYMAW